MKTPAAPTSFSSASVRSGCAAISAAKVCRCGSSMPRRPCRWTRGATSPVSRRRCFSSRTHARAARRGHPDSTSPRPIGLASTSRTEAVGRPRRVRARRPPAPKRGSGSPPPRLAASHVPPSCPSQPQCSRGSAGRGGRSRRRRRRLRHRCRRRGYWSRRRGAPRRTRPPGSSRRGS